MKYLYICIYLIKNNDMKLLMKRAFTVVLAAVLLFGCGEDNNKTGGNELTPQENKAKLEQLSLIHI